MRAVPLASLLTGPACALSLLLSFPHLAQAQYLHDGPAKPAVEIDLSVLDDPAQRPALSAPPSSLPSMARPPGFPPPITAPVPPAPVERQPLAPMPSPYENSRVVNRIELEGANPYSGGATPSPFNPPALLKPPAATTVRAPEAPRTAPVILKPAPTRAVNSADAPVVIEAEPERMQDGVEMPAINVTDDIREQEPRTTPVAARRKSPVIALPRRKPAVLSLATEVPAPHSTASAAQTDETSDLSPVSPTTPAPAAPPPPGVRKTAEMVIDDLYTLPPRSPDHTALLLPNEVTPPPAASAPMVDGANVAGSLAFLDNAVTLDDSMHQVIDRIAATLEGNASSRLLIKGYAHGDEGTRASARRLSVSRALAVRSYLMDKGIKPSRVDVRGMGSDSTNEQAPLDRVDLVLIP